MIRISVVCRTIIVLLLSATPIRTYQLRFLKTDPDNARPIPFICSTDPNADITSTFGAGAMFPSIVELPRNNRTGMVRVHPDAAFYLYYAAHRGKHIGMAWSSSLSGPWHEYSNPKFCGNNNNNDKPTQGVCRRGVMPLPQPKRNWDHVSAPHVLYNPKHNRWTMFYHGRHRGKGGHSSFVASSGDGLDFSGSYTNISLLYGQGTAHYGRRPIVVGANYSRPFSHDADGDGRPEFYVIGKRGRVCRLSQNIWSSPVEKWANQPHRCDTIPNNEFHVTEKPPNGTNFMYQYISILTEFLASREFAHHKNNPHPGQTVHSFANMDNKNLAYQVGVLHFVNHVGIWKRASVLEVYFYVKSPQLRNGESLQTFKGLYRVMYDLRDYRTEEQKRDGIIEPYETWRLLRGSDGQVVFDEIISPDLGLGAAGDSFVHTFSDGRKYIFFTTGPEGSIYGAELTQSDDHSPP